jgi:hypothetical protein
MHILVDDLELYLLGRLPEAKSSVIARHLSGCKYCDRLLIETLAFVQKMQELSQRVASGKNHTDRGEHPGISTGDLASMRSLRPSLAELEDIRILDASAGDFMILVRQPLERGALIQMRLKKLVVLAKVRGCQRFGNLYHAHIAIKYAGPNVE